MWNSRKVIIRIILIALFMGSMSRNPDQVHAQGGIVVEDAKVEINFGRTIIFTAKIKSSIPIQQASLLFRGVNEEATRVRRSKLQVTGR